MAFALVLERDYDKLLVEDVKLRRRVEAKS
jgi:hypothetical protein